MRCTCVYYAHKSCEWNAKCSIKRHVTNKSDLLNINFDFFPPALPSCSSREVSLWLHPLCLSCRNETHLRSAQCQTTSGLANHAFIHSKVLINVPALFCLSGDVCYQPSVLDTRLTDRATHFSRAAATSCRP